MPLPNTVEEAYATVNPLLPLGLSAEDSVYYVDCQAARGGQDVIGPLFRDIRRSTPPNFSRYLFTGHRGSGKSTELLRLKRMLEQDGYFVVYLDAAAELALADIDYPDVLLAIARQVEAQLRDTANIHLLPELLEDLIRWFASILLKQSGEALDQTLQVDYGLGVVTPATVYARVLTACQQEIKSSSTRRAEMREAMERRAAQLIERVNDLLRNARARLQQGRYTDLVVIADSLDRLLYRYDDTHKRGNYETLFIEHGEQLCAPECHLVLTVPYSLVFHANLGQLFPQRVILSLIRTHEVDGTPAPLGRETLTSLLGARMNLSAVFASPGLVEDLVDFSGGHLRDLFRLAAYALEQTDTVVQPEHARYARRKLTLDYDYVLRDEDIYRLRVVHKTKRIPIDDAHARLLHNLLVLEYVQDQRWGDVHPAVRASARFTQAR